MSYFFKNPGEKIFNLKDLSKDALLYRVMPHFMMEIMRKYFRLQIEGIEHVPKRCRGLILPNHSGYTAFDAMVIAHEVHKATGRVARVLSHPLWFVTETTALPATKLGFYEATTANGLKFLKKNNLVMLFPEGEKGNFKPTSRRYRLAEFKRGFVRMALQTQSPIIPTLVIGAEETHINLRELKFAKYIIGSVLPLPLNVIPLPARWKIKFLPPIKLPYKADKANDTELVHEIASDIQEQMQAALREEIKNRESIFL